jgi:hypothetical protein
MSTRSPQPLSIAVHQNGKSIHMALSLRGITVGDGKYPLVDTVRGYVVRYRLALYLLSAVAVA